MTQYRLKFSRYTLTLRPMAWVLGILCALCAASILVAYVDALRQAVQRGQDLRQAQRDSSSYSAPQPGARPGPAFVMTVSR